MNGGPLLSAKGLTLIELLISIAIILTLAGILYLTLGPVRERGRETNCVNNFRQIGLALQMYREDYGGEDPPGAQTLAAAGLPCDPPDYALRSYVRTQDVFHCQSEYWPDAKDQDRQFDYMWPAVPDEMLLGGPPPELGTPPEERLYSRVLASRGMDAPYLADPHHGTFLRPAAIPSREYPLVLVLRISGQVQRKRATTQDSLQW